jgi:hypothetical protein
LEVGFSDGEAGWGTAELLKQVIPHKYRGDRNGIVIPLDLNLANTHFGR